MHLLMNRRPNKRRFRGANSGVVFEFLSKDFPDATPVIFLLASDASFSGQHREHHPIYRELYLSLSVSSPLLPFLKLSLSLGHLHAFCFLPAVSLLNIHEDVRCKPSAWVPVGWIPKYDPKLAVGRPTTGMTCHASRKVDLFHQCFCLLLEELVGQEGLMDIAWGDGITRQCFVRLGGFIGDQQEADRVAGQVGTCHRCHSSRKDFLETKRFARQKTTWETKKAVLAAAAGAHSRGKPVVEWDANGRRKAGKSVQSYERVRKIAGSHLVQNAFWLVQGFCACQMLMRDPMHQIDHGVIVYLLRAILWHYVESVEKQLQVPCKSAAQKLTARLNMVLGRRVGENGQAMKGAHDTLIALSKTTRSVFDELGENVRSTPKVHSSIRATDIRHLLLLLPLICHDLFRSEVAQHNQIPGNKYIEDPSPEIVAVCVLLLKWYHLYRSNDGHDTDDLSLLDRLARQFFEMCKTVFPYKNLAGWWIMGTDKVHFMIHAASEIMKWGGLINCSAEVVEEGHKTWVKQQGQNTNQGDSAAKTMMKNSLQKIASMELTQAIKGRVMRFYIEFITFTLRIYVFTHIVFTHANRSH